MFFISFYFWYECFFICFSCIIAPTKTSSFGLNRSSKSEHSCLVPYLRRKAFHSLLLSVMSAAELSFMAFITFKCIPFYLFCWLLIMKGITIFKCFLASSEIIIWFLFFSLLMCCVTFIDLLMLTILAGVISYNHEV